MRLKKRWIGLLSSSLLLPLLVVSVFAAVAQADTTATASQANAASSAAKPALDGAKVYAWNCGSCHSERWPKERSDAEWDVIATHMKVRANMTKAQTDAVLRYLKENNE